MLNSESSEYSPPKTCDKYHDTEGEEKIIMNQLEYDHFTQTN